MRDGRIAACALGALLLAGAASAQGVRPGELLVYYGYPSAINATYSVPAAAATFAPYDIVVWGDGLDAPAHPDHANATAILATPSMSATRVFGYVDLGVITQNLPPSEIEARISHWKQMGARGVFLDDFGYDYGTTRARQNAAVSYAHSLGLPVIANAWLPADVFGAAADPLHNPSGIATVLGAADYYLYESHGIREGAYEDGPWWTAKSSALAAYQQSLGFGVLSITTTLSDGPGGFDAAGFAYSWHAALLAGHAATGWGEFGFSAYGASNCVAPHRTRPATAPGAAFTGPAIHDGSRHWRTTDTGVIRLDSATHTCAFQPGFAEATAAAPIRELSVSPNPAIHAARIHFGLLRDGPVSLAVFDLAGRRVALLARAFMPAGRHDIPWDCRGASGVAVSPGLYLVRLETREGKSTTKLAIAR